MQETAVIDLTIIGAGPIGIACGIAAGQAGLSYRILEKGCLVNSLYNYPLNMTFFSSSERLEIGGVPFMSLNPKPGRAEALEYYRRVVQQFNLKIGLFESVESIQRDKNLFQISTSKTQYRSRKVVIATGFYDEPVMMNIPGESLPKVRHYYFDPHFYGGRDVLVVGANNSSVDAALETWRKGARVTMVIRGESIGRRVKYWVRPDIENRIKEGSIRAFFSSNLEAITERSVLIRDAEGIMHELPNDEVLAMTGYQPSFRLLQSAGVDILSEPWLRPAYNPETMETNVPGLYLAGVVCGGMDTQLVH
jgi:thioredoxin reductase (NADPH)